VPNGLGVGTPWGARRGGEGGLIFGTGRGHFGHPPLLKAYGIMGFKGTAEEAEDFALGPELLPEECR